MTHGLALQLNQKSVQNTDLNTPAPARVIPAVSEKPAIINTLHVSVSALIHGMGKRVLVLRHINILAAVSAIRVAAALPVAANIRHVVALVNMCGAMEIV